MLWQYNANPSYKLASIPRYDDIVWTAGWEESARAAGRWLPSDGGRFQNCAPYMGSGCGWLAGDWPPTGCVLNITATVWTAGFNWWSSGNKKWTQNVSEYMLVLALCLVWFLFIVHFPYLFLFLVQCDRLSRLSISFFQPTIYFSYHIIHGLHVCSPQQWLKEMIPRKASTTATWHFSMHETLNVQW